MKKMLKENKKREREEKKKLREALKSQKQSKKKQIKRKRTHTSDSSSEEDRNLKITYDDSDSDTCETEINTNCTVCKEGCKLQEYIDWAECVICERKWHVSCTDNLILQSLTPDELKDHQYFCDQCVFSN
ncbi:MAG: hypothetical protein AB2693_23475 [Candidatus Thiodiazotropha sp.]